MRITSYSIEVNPDRTINLVKESAVNYQTSKPDLSSPEAIAMMFSDVFRLGQKAEEYFYILCLNTALRPIGVFEISHGGGDYAKVSMREIMQRVLLSGATRFVAVHNHPSGELIASQDDIDITRKIATVSKLMDVGFLDHIIISGYDYCSMRERHAHLQLFN